jgi:hypothetical protein
MSRKLASNVACPTPPPRLASRCADDSARRVEYSLSHSSHLQNTRLPQRAFRKGISFRGTDLSGGLSGSFSNSPDDETAVF